MDANRKLILTIGTRGVPVVHRSRLDSRLSPDNGGGCLERQVNPVGDWGSTAHGYLPLYNSKFTHNSAPMRLHLLIRHDLPTRSNCSICLSGCKPHNNRASAALFIFYRAWQVYLIPIRWTIFYFYLASCSTTLLLGRQNFNFYLAVQTIQQPFF
jgi:hypothetical protein